MEVVEVVVDPIPTVGPVVEVEPEDSLKLLGP
jgi:hypothetical protein